MIQKVKIVQEVALREGKTALQLSVFPSHEWIKDFGDWAKQHGINEYVTVENFYVSEMFGDVDYPAIQISKNAPGVVKTVCLLTWS